jgi:hypothetical protein
MGYYTSFTLKYTGDLDRQTLVTELEKITPYTWYDDLILPDVKWYDYQTHMKLISKKYPDILFILDGEGEESGDIWRQYFKNGLSKFDRAELSFPEFDESQLE